MSVRSIPNSWQSILIEEINNPYFQNLQNSALDLFGKPPIDWQITDI
jgi:hypothetical protein